MMEWTDRHCRRLHRCYSANARLYTEMVTTGALLRGPRERLLAFDAAEQPVVLQLGGCDPSQLAQCAVLAQHAGFCEINLNIGCPSDRVQHARIGACLMREPTLVGQCARALRDACELPITIKCRLGLDGDDNDRFLFHFLEQVARCGVNTFILHARIAILGGLSPAQNRSLPPLNYPRIARAKTRFPQLCFVINGGLDTAETALAMLDATGCDGVMIGRAAYRNPWLLAELDHALFVTPMPQNRLQPIHQYMPYLSDQLASGERLHAMSRHLHGVANGLPGARAFRRYLSDFSQSADAGTETLINALDLIREPQAA